MRRDSLLDTGADECVITREFAELLGVTPKPIIAHLSTAGGEIAVEYGHVEVEVEMDGESYRLAIIVGIVDQPWQEPLLGRTGFLEMFDVTFLGDEHEVELLRNNRASNAPLSS